MNRCKQIVAQITFYLDDELQGADRAELEAHLRQCDSCSTVFENEKQFLTSIREAKPLYSAGPELHSTVTKALADSPKPLSASSELRRRVGGALRSSDIQRQTIITLPRIVVAVSLVALCAAIAMWRFASVRTDVRHLPPSDFALMAVDTHQRHLRSQLPLEISSDQPEEISSWFSGKVPFGVKLPNYQEISGQQKLYTLEGARLVGYKNDYAAYVAYEMNMRPISLVVTSDSVAQAAGGEAIVSQGITFHYDSIQGLKVISWSDRGLTYALVSDLEERGQQSCIVCHQGTKDKDFIEGLKPR